MCKCVQTNRDLERCDSSALGPQMLLVQPCIPASAEDVSAPMLSQTKSHDYYGVAFRHSEDQAEFCKVHCPCQGHWGHGILGARHL